MEGSEQLKAAAQRPGQSDYPVHTLDIPEMNRTLRHRIRNVCAGMKMSLDAMEPRMPQDQTIVERLKLMHQDLDRLQEFTERLDLLFERLPSPQPASVNDMVANLRDFFKKRFPLCPVDWDGPGSQAQLLCASWFELALRELLTNAAEAAGHDNQVKMVWQVDPDLEFAVVNTGEAWPEHVPTAPPVPFTTTKGRHDGIGLCIVRRLCEALDTDMTVHTDMPELTAVKLSANREDHLHGESG